MKGSETSSVQRAAANFGLMVASSLVLLATMEGGLRAYDWIRSGIPTVNVNPAQDLYLPHPYLPVVLRPGTDYRDGEMARSISALLAAGSSSAAH